MKALSLRQPWATLVALRRKRIETRAWATPYRGPLAIHAARRWGPDQVAICRDHPFVDALEPALRPDGWPRAHPDYATLLTELPRGAIVAVAELVECVQIRAGRRVRTVGAVVVPPFEDSAEWAFGDYRDGRVAWVLAKVRPLTEPLPCRGWQGLWTLPPEMVRELERRVA